MSEILDRDEHFIIDEYPKTCAECPFGKIYTDIDMGAIIGTVVCHLSFKDSRFDSRQFYERARYERKDGCNIEHDKRVDIREE